MKFEEYINETTPFDDYGLDGINGNLITEAGLSRVLSSIKESESFVIMSAYRSEYSKKENIIRNRNLRTKFNKKKMGVYQLVGHWRECKDDKIEYKDCPENMLVDVIERSYLSKKPDEMSQKDFELFIIELLKEFKQDGAVLKDGSSFYIIDKNGKKIKIGENLKLNKISQAYSSFVKKSNVPFVFEGVEIPSSNSGRMIASKIGIKYPVGEFNDVKNWKDIISYNN